MNKHLEEELQKYLGELMYAEETTYNWEDRSRIISKLNAVYILLDIPYEERTYFDVIKKVINESKIS